MSGHLAIIDGNSIVCRAFFGGPKDKVGRNGQDVGAVSTFVEMLWRILGDAELGDITHIAAVFDGGGRNHRHDMYPEYKANRKKKPDGLLDQLDLCRAALTRLDIATLCVPGSEADDVIASLACDARKQGMRVIIVSNDKDFRQLLDDHITLFNPYKGKAGRIGPEEVFKEWGVRPDQVVDYLAICGDKVDNVPGVNGIGGKTASFLLQRLGTIEAIYDEIETAPISVGFQTKLVAGRDNAFLSKRLVTLVRDLPVLDMLYSDLEIGHVRPGREFLKFLDDLGLPILREKIARRLGYIEAKELAETAEAAA